MNWRAVFTEIVRAVAVTVLSIVLNELLKGRRGKYDKYRICACEHGRPSLAAQLEALKTCDKVFQEKESGAKADRPQLALMLDYAREGDIITVTKLCRLARNTKHLLEIVEYLDGKSVSLVVLNLGIDTKSPTGRLMLTMIGAVASFERELLLERQAEGIAIAKAKGKYKGRKPIEMAKGFLVMQLLTSGMSKKEASIKTGLSLSSIYRITAKKL